MNKEQWNWIKFAMLMVNVAQYVLRRLLSETVQTPFLNDLVYSWLEQVQEIQNTNYAASLLLSFTKDIKDMDDNFSAILNKRIHSWKFTRRKRLTLSEELSTLDQWRQDIEELRFSCPLNVQQRLLSWRGHIKERRKTLRTMSNCLKQWTTILIKRCHEYRQDLLRKRKEYYDDLLSTSRDKLSNWRSKRKKDLKKVIKNLQTNREDKLKIWKTESEKCLKYFLRDIKELLKSWSLDTNIPELKKLLDDFETEASEMDDTRLQTSCDTWHEELHALFDNWLEEMDERDKDYRSFYLETSWKQLKCFRSVESVQVNDFLDSIEQTRTLQTELSKKQLSKLRSCYDQNLNDCDITIICILLKNCFVYPPMKGWNELPQEIDMSVGADILRLQNLARCIVSLKKLRMNTMMFDQLCRDIKVVLCRLASVWGDEYKKTVTDKLNKCIYAEQVKQSDMHIIFEFCENELNGIMKLRKCEELVDSFKRVKRTKRVLKEISDSSSDSESSGSSRHSG